MVSALLLGVAGAATALVATTDLRNRRRGDPPDRRRELTPAQVGGGASVAALVGFDGAFGRVTARRGRPYRPTRRRITLPTPAERPKRVIPVRHDHDIWT